MNLLFRMPAKVLSIASASLVAIGIAAAFPAHAARPVIAHGTPSIAPSDTTAPLPLDAGKGMLLRLSEDAGSIFVVDPAIADVHSPAPREIYVLGKKPGTTSLYVLGATNKTLVQRTVVVSRDMDEVRNMLQTRFPDAPLTLSGSEGSLIVTGQVKDATEANGVVESLTPYLQAKEVLVNRMTVGEPQQVQLQVKITEVDRNVTQELGINWSSLSNAAGNFVGGIYSGRQFINYSNPITSSTGSTVYPFELASNNAYSFEAGFKTGNTDISAVIDALNQEGLLTVLAEPNLVALSGQTASFLAGGEYPIPVSQVNGAISVDFKNFGVKLDFTPTVLNNGRISLKVRPEVSQIDSSVSVTTGGLTIPGLSIRRADTTVELSSGQSFAIAGLLENTTSDTISQVPGLGSIPILGKLFTSKNYTNNKTELVITVTPYIVKPVDPGKLRSPLSSLVGPGNDVEYTLMHSSGDSNPPPGSPRLQGAAGYVY